MGTIIFEGSKPFELATQKKPTTVAEGETVVVTLPVALPGTPGHVVEVRLLLELQHAIYLAGQIQPAIVVAQHFRD